MRVAAISIKAVAKISRHFNRSPERLGLEDVRAFQVYLVSQGMSWPALNLTVCALRFFHGVTLNRAEIPERIAYARTPPYSPDPHLIEQAVAKLKHWMRTAAPRSRETL